MRAIVAQIRAIASQVVSHNSESPTYREAQLLSARLALAEALATVDGRLRWRRLERQQGKQDVEGLFG